MQFGVISALTWLPIQLVKLFEGLRNSDFQKYIQTSLHKSKGAKTFLQRLSNTLNKINAAQRL